MAGTEALVAALAQGRGFRIGLPDDPLPEAEGFETLTSGSTGQPRRTHSLMPPSTDLTWS